MTNITHSVWAYLNKHPALTKCLALDVVNTRALANHIINEEHLKASTHAALSAIRRYSADHAVSSSSKKLSKLLQEAKISTKSRIISLAISRDFTFLASIMPKIFHTIDVTKGEMLRLAEGRQSMTLFLDARKEKEITGMISGHRIFGVQRNLGEINIDFGKESTPSLLSATLNELSANDIEIIQVIGGTPELVLIIKESDIAKTHDVLLNYFYKKN